MITKMGFSKDFNISLKIITYILYVILIENVINLQNETKFPLI